MAVGGEMGQSPPRSSPTPVPLTLLRWTALPRLTETPVRKRVLLSQVVFLMSKIQCFDHNIFFPFFFFTLINVCFLE